MSFRGYKKEVEKERKRLEQEKKERNTLLQLENLSADFGQRRKGYLEGAKKALKEGDEAAYESNVALVKNIMFQKAQIDDMITNYKMAKDLRDMGMVRADFSKLIVSVMKAVERLGDGIRFKDVEKSFTKGVYSSEQASQKLRDVLALNGANFANYADKVSEIRDSDIRQIIEGEVGKDAVDIDKQLSLFEAELKKDIKKETKMSTVKTEPKESAAFGGNALTGKPTPPPEEKGKSNEKDTEQVDVAAMKKSEPIKEAPKTEKRKSSTPEDKVLKGDIINEEYVFNWDSLPATTFADIAGLETVKSEVREKVLLPLTHPELFEGFCQDTGGGLLLYGPPGTGKTMIAAAIANEVGAKFCSIKPSDLLHQGAGNSEKAVRSLFSQARSFDCAIIFFDEMDSIAPKDTRSQYSKQLRSELLSQLQGIEAYGKKDGHILFLIAATNKPWDMDSAFLRPGRFGTRIYVGLPDDDARRYIIQHTLDKILKEGIVEVDANLNIDEIVTRTEGFNGADMTALMSKAKGSAILRTQTTGKKELLQEDFEKALEVLKSSVQRADIEKLQAWEKQM